MSSEDLTTEIQLLREQNEFLRREVQRLGLERRRTQESEIGQWEVIEEASFSDQAPVPLSLKFRLEEGPPELPQRCILLAKRNLKPGKFSTEERAKAAFLTGFWTRIAIETDTHFVDSHSLKGLSNCLWVAFRGAIGGLPVRASRKADCLKACWEDSDQIIIGFASLTELHIACCGAGLALPKHIQWRSHQ